MRSIRYKHDDSLHLFSSLMFSFDVMLFTETWLTADENPPYFENYTYIMVLYAHMAMEVV